MGRKSSLCPDFAPELVNDLKNFTAISKETEDVLLELMNEGKFVALRDGYWAGISKGKIILIPI